MFCQFGTASPKTNPPCNAISATVVSFDASPGDVAAILAGNEAASVAQFPAKMGSLGAQTALDAATGKAVRANVDTGTEMVTKDNASQFQ